MAAKNDLEKTILRVTQDFCFNNSTIFLCNEFAMSICPHIVKHIKSNSLNLSKLTHIVKKRKDFFIANDIDNIFLFCKGLFKKLNHELSFYESESFLESMITFKRKMENGNFRGYPKKTTSEDTLRCTLAVYIEQETFCEPRSSSGNNDITVPSEKVIIETKLWKGIEYYKSGFPELNDYLNKSNYFEGYYIIFDYTQNNNEIIEQHGECFDQKYNEKLVHVIFVKMNSVRPSKIYNESKSKIPT